MWLWKNKKETIGSEPFLEPDERTTEGVIEKSAKPRCFKSANMDWKLNSKAWMATQIMTVWLEKFDNNKQFIN